MTAPIQTHTNVVTPSSIADVQNAVTSAGGAGRQIFPTGGRTKSALSTLAADASYTTSRLDMTGLSGILEYQPNEYTFTALAGTPISTVEDTLAEKGQYLPFEPPLNQSGATLGGTIAAGLSGAGRYRYGGVRDFLIGVRFVDGKGDLIMGGGKVVKNAAGFDLPKLMVGSLGRLGILVEASFKVFPSPSTYRTLQIDFPSLADALEGLGKLVVAPMDIDAVEMIPSTTEGSVQMLIRVGGLESVLYARLGRLEDMLMEGTIVDLEQEPALWQGQRNFAWAGSGSDGPSNDAAIVKIPISPERIAQLDSALASYNVKRIYSVGGHLCWLAWTESMTQLDAILQAQSLSGLVLTTTESALDSGIAGPYVGKQNGLAFAKRIQQGIDPEGRFLPVA